MNKVYVRNVMASEALDSLDTVQCFGEIHGDKQINVNAKWINRKSGNNQVTKR